MRKQKIFHIILTSILIGSMANSLFMKPTLAFAATPLDNIDTSKVLDMNFNNNNAINIVNNKVYSPTTTNANYVSSIKGKGYEANNSKIIIPFNHLGITSNDSILTVAFLMKYGGSDTNFMPIGIAGYGEGDVGGNDLWFYNGVFGFNTGKGDNIGIRSPFIKDEYYSVIAEFNSNDVSKNKLYINGVKQDISYLLNNTSYKNSWNENSSFSIGGFATNNTYNISDKTVIDEVTIYKKSLTTDEIKAVSKSHQIPELRTEVVNNNNVSVSWATEILQENLLWNAGFEENERRPSLSYATSPITGSNLGEQSFSPNAKYSGYLGYQLLDTYNGKGNNYLFPSTQSNSSKTTWNSLKNVIDKNMNLSISVMAKSTGNSTFAIGGQGGFETKLYNWTSKLVKDVAKGDVWLYVDKLDPSWKVQSDGVTPVSQYKVFPDEYDNSIVQDNHIREIDVANKRIRLASGVYRNMKAGETLKRRNWVNPFSGGNASIGNTNTWTLYNFNTTVFDNPYYDPMSRGFSLIMTNSTNKTLYLDDLKLGYATKVKLYRNNSKIYEGYASTCNDTFATDKANPNAVSNIKHQITIDDNYNRDINITFNASKDNGTSYSYNITSIDKNNVESPLSKTQTKILTSGIKGYSYIIDKSPSTIPDNTIDTTNTSIKSNIKDSGVHYLHIKAIDNAGNASSVVHYKIDIPILTAKPESNNNRIKLNWTLSDSSNKIFKVYQKREDSSIFQSISTTNLASNSKVKVLNIYPIIDVYDESRLIPTETFTNWQKQTYTLPQSARLKRWMEEPTSYIDANGNKINVPYGYGKGIISVDAIGINSFNSNPDKYLKNADGTYKYNVIMIGSWDYNGNRFGNADMTKEAASKIQSFVNAGHGLLIGHDVASTINPIMFNQFKDSVKVDVKSIANIYGTNIRLKKKGILTNYPWIIADNLTIPYTHTQSQICYGDIWMEFSDGGSLTDNKGGEANSYLTTHNNVAMIQTGHSRGVATPDEQQILANTLFYLNQISSDTFLTDNSGQDVKAPDAPAVKLLSSTSSAFNFDLSETKDNGSKYEYYVISEDKLGNTLTSNTTSATITTGIKGYSYVLDKQATTEPPNTVNLTSDKLTLNNLDNNTIYYLHIKAIDNANNVSKTTHFKISTAAPIAPVLNLSRTGWGNTDASFTISQNHNKNVKLLYLSTYTNAPFITRLKALGYNITSNSSLTNIDEIKKYDIVISDGHYWSVENAALLNKLYNNGVKLITGGNDTGNSILPIVSSQNVGSEANLNIDRVVKNEATFALPSYNPGNDSSSYIITQAMTNSKIWYKTTSFNSPSILSIQNGRGGEWIHTQSILGGNALRQSDELLMGLIDYLTQSISQVHLQDVQYKINDGNWTSYNGEAIVLSNEGNYNISVRNIDTRGVASMVDTQTVGIDKTTPTGNTSTNKTTTSRTITVTVNNLQDNLSGLNKVRISNYSDFRDSTGYTSILNKTSVDLKIELPFISKVEENYSTRTVYIEIQDTVGNKKVLTCSTKYEPKQPTVTITSPQTNAFVSSKESLSISWIYNGANNDNVILPQSKAIITANKIDATNPKQFSTTITGTSTSALLPKLEAGEYSISVTVYNSLGKYIVSDPIKIRCNIFNTTGYVNTIAISVGSPLKFISVFSEVEIPSGTEIKGYIYYTENKSDAFDEQNKIQFTIDNNKVGSEVIKLPKTSSKIKVKYELYNKTTNKQLSPALCRITVLGK